MKTATPKKATRKREPKPTTAKKRPNKSFIKKMAEFRGYMKCNEKLMLEGLTVKNVLQRIANRAFDDEIKATDCKELQKLMKAFVKDVDAIIKK